MEYGDKEYKAMMNKPFTGDTVCEFVGGALDGRKMKVSDVLKECKIRGKHKDWSNERGEMISGCGGCPYPILTTRRWLRAMSGLWRDFPRHRFVTRLKACMICCPCD